MDRARGPTPSRTVTGYGSQGGRCWPTATARCARGRSRENPLWSFGRPGARVELPVVDAARKTVYALLTEEKPVGHGSDGAIYWGRWPSSESVRSILALDLETGKPRWENTDLASRDTGMFDTKTKRRVISGFGQLLPAGEHLIAVNNNSISGGRSALIASLDAATGRTVQFDPKPLVKSMRASGEIEWHGFLYQTLWRDGRVYLMGASRILGFDPVSGAVTQLLDIPWNARCVRPVATPAHFLMGQTAFIGADFSGEMIAVARSGCAQSPIPASGLVMFGPHMCACTTHFDGFLALSPRGVPEPVADSARLQKPAPTGVPVPPPSRPPASLVANAWPWFTISAPVQPATVEAGGWSFAIDPQRHRVDAREPGGRSWAWVGDARLGTSVVVSDGVAVLGSHDGWVTGLDLLTGVPRWRYLAAPAERLAVANGMLTSTWPVFGVADLGEGRVVATAGTHAELDGGIRVVALNAADGRPVWSRTVAKTRSQIPPGGRGARIADRSIINTAPAVEGGRIVLAGGEHLGRLEIDPNEAEADLNRRLSTPPDKRR